MPDELPGMQEESDLIGGETAEKYDYPKTNSGPLCSAEETGYLDSTDVFCPFGLESENYKCTGGCPTNRKRICILGEY